MIFKFKAKDNYRNGFEQLKIKKGKVYEGEFATGHIEIFESEGGGNFYTNINDFEIISGETPEGKSTAESLINKIKEKENEIKTLEEKLEKRMKEREKLEEKLDNIGGVKWKKNS